MWAPLTIAALISAAAPVPTPPHEAPTAVAVVSADGILHRDTRHADLDHVYYFGSVSKPVTAAAVAEAGIPRDMRIDAAVPTLAGTDLAARGTTVGDLLDHTSGLPHEVTLTDRARTDSATAIVPDVADVPLGERGTYSYSSLNYLLLQAALEQATGDAAASLAQVAPGVVTDGSVPAGRVPFFTGSLPRTAPFDAAGLGYGYLAGDIDTLSGFASDQLVDPSDAWQEETMSINGRGVTAFRHNGAVPGSFAHVTLVPELDRAVVLLSARYGETEAQQLNDWADAVVQSQLGGTPGEIPPASRLPLWSGLGLVLMLVLAGMALRVRPRWWVAALTAVAAAILLVAPLLLGYPLSVMWLWAPDLAAILAAGATILAGTAMVTAVRLARSSRRSRPLHSQ